MSSLREKVTELLEHQEKGHSVTGWEDYEYVGFKCLCGKRLVWYKGGWKDVPPDLKAAILKFSSFNDFVREVPELRDLVVRSKSRFDRMALD